MDKPKHFVHIYFVHLMLIIPVKLILSKKIKSLFQHDFDLISIIYREFLMAINITGKCERVKPSSM